MLRVPKGLDPERISATVADGVLTLRLPKPVARRPRRIEITSATAQPMVEQTTDERELVGNA